MNFHFDIDKSIAATAYLLKKNGGSEDIIFLVKMLYDANRESLLQFGRSITGDSFFSMEHGPVVSQTYAFLNGTPRASRSVVEKWSHFISPRSGNTVKIVEGSKPEIGYLSKREIDLLDISFAKVKAVKGTLSDWAHRVFPEWEKVPANTSKPLPAERIFEKQNVHPAEISSISDEIGNLTWLKMALAK